MAQITLNSSGVASSGSLVLQTNGTTSAVTVDASQNVGIGVTPSAWVSGKWIQIQSASAVGQQGNGTANLMTNAYESSANTFSYILTDAASRYNAQRGSHAWFSASSGTAGNAITFTQVMTLDTSGNLCVGTTSQSGNAKVTITAAASNAAITVSAASSGNTGYAFGTGNYGFIDFNSGAGTGYVRISAINDGGSYANPIVFGHNTNAVYGSSTFTERARINSSGQFLVGATDATYGGVGSCKFTVKSATSDGAALFYTGFSGDVSTSAVNIGKFDNNNTTSQLFVKFAINNAGLGCGQINGNGSGAAAFGSFSDSRIKENIVDLPSQLSNIMALRPVEFDYVESYGGGHQVGFVAQEMQEVFPDTVSEDNSEEKILSVTGWSKTEARLVKAIQELNTKFEAYKASHP